MLRHSVTRKVRGVQEDFIELLMHPEKFLRLSSYVEEIVRKNDNKYEVVFKWTKWGMTKRYWVKFRVYRDANTVVYESTPESDNRMNMSITIIRDPEQGYITVKLDIEMDAGTLASILGRGDFSKFAENLLDAAIKEYMKKHMIGSEKKIDCRNCAFYEAMRSYCYELDKPVEDPVNPPCGGARYKETS